MFGQVKCPECGSFKVQKLSKHEVSDAVGSMGCLLSVFTLPLGLLTMALAGVMNLIGGAIRIVTAPVRIPVEMAIHKPTHVCKSCGFRFRP